VLVNTARVEKSYFDARALVPESIAEHLALGLEQARDTRPPEVLVRKRFRPFVEDELDRVVDGAERLLLHPGGTVPLSAKAASRTAIAIGPEGGFVPFEVELLSAHGFVPRTLGPRTLRVEVAIACAIGRLTAT
jgi:RsmE family RNA methyltransferase